MLLALSLSRETRKSKDTSRLAKLKGIKIAKCNTGGRDVLFVFFLFILHILLHVWELIIEIVSRAN